MNQKILDLVEKIKDVAIFDGWQLVGQPKYMHPTVWFEKPGVPGTHAVMYVNGFGNIADITIEMGYHYDWNSIIRVMDKIVQLDEGYIFEINYPEGCCLYAKGDRIIPVIRTSGTNGTRNVFETIWKFVSTYNELRKSPQDDSI